jgi:hypothetical protein
MMTWTEWVRKILKNDEEDLKELLGDLDLLIELERQVVHEGFARFDLLSEEIKMGDAEDLKTRIKEMADFIRRRFPEGLPPKIQ